MGMNDSNQNLPGSIHKDNNSRKNLTIYHQNIRGISNKTDEFQIPYIITGHKLYA